jgi:hypothetical protein
VTLLNFLPAVTVMALLLGFVAILFTFRTRSMRAFAARRGFKYIGPSVPSFWGFYYFRKVKPLFRFPTLVIW